MFIQRPWKVLLESVFLAHMCKTTKESHARYIYLVYGCAIVRLLSSKPVQNNNTIL